MASDLVVAWFEGFGSTEKLHYLSKDAAWEIGTSGRLSAAGSLSLYRFFRGSCGGDTLYTADGFRHVLMEGK